MKRAYSGRRRLLLLIVVLLVMTAYGHGNAGEAGSGNVTPPIPEMTEALIPLVLAVLTPPHPVPGSDGLFYLVYELYVTNASGLRWHIESVTVQDAENRNVVVATISGADLPSKEFDEAEREGTPLNIRSVMNPERHQHELPLDLAVVNFP